MENKRLLENHRLSALSLAVAASLQMAFAAPQAIAQNVRSASALEEVVVTAQRRVESLQDTPIAITAFTEDKLGDLGVYDLSEVGDYAPNVSMRMVPSSNTGMAVNIRGIGSQDTALTGDPKVGIYIDGIYMSKTVGAVFDIVDMERLEILRGPQGTLFGRNTTGGAMSVTTKKPSGELGGKVNVSVGNFGYLRYGGSLDLPAVGDFSAKLSYMGMETDGWATNHYRGEPIAPLKKVEKNLASEDNESYRIALRWTPTESLSFDYSFDKTDNKGVATPIQPTTVKSSLYNGFTTTPFDYATLGGSLYQQMANNIGDPKKRRKHYQLDGIGQEWLKVEGHSFIAAWDAADNVTLKYLYGKRKTDSGYHGSDMDGGAYTARDLFYGVYQGQNGEIPMSGFHASIDMGVIDMESHEFQIIGTAFEERLHYTGGLFYHNEDVKQSNPQSPTLPIAFLTPQGADTPGLGALYDAADFCPDTYGGALCIGTQRMPIPGAGDSGIPGMVDFQYGQNAKSAAIYGQGTYSVTERFDLTLGLRYTEDKKKGYFYNQNVDGTSFSNPTKADNKWDNLSYMVNANYIVSDDVRVYLNYATGYNSGGYNARASNIASFQTPYDEEEVKIWELGLKSEWLDNRLRLNMAVFTNDYSDIQITQSEAGSGGASGRIVNAGQGTYEGIEFDVILVPVDGLTIDLTYGYLDAEFDEYMARNPETDILEDISNRTTVPRAPKNSASLGLQYDFEPFSFGSLSSRLDLSYQDKMVFHAFNNSYDAADSRTLLNGRVSLNDIKLGRGANKGSLRVSLWGKNLTDEEYRVWGIDFASLGFAVNTFGEPRSYGIDVVYSYD